MSEESNKAQSNQAQTVPAPDVFEPSPMPLPFYELSPLAQGQFAQVPFAQKPFPQEPPPNKPADLTSDSAPESGGFVKRLVFVLMFVLFVILTLVYSPNIAEKIAYSWNIGIERARAETAKQFLAESPLEEQRIAWVAKAAAPSVVGILTISPIEMPARGRGGRRIDNGRREEYRDHFDDHQESLVTGYGSGVIIDEQGYVLTNNHVIENAHVIRVELSDGRTVEAEVIGRDAVVDLAVLRISADDLIAVPWGDSRNVSVGDQVVAVGSPYGLQRTVTSGIISATERYSAALMQEPRSGGRLVSHEYLQTDAAINPGNSGGPLVDMNGQLIGICVAIAVNENGGNSGIGFVIPSFLAKHVCDEIMTHGEVRHGWMGVALENVTPIESKRMGQSKPMGAIVGGFMPQSPAREAGLRREDIILRWGETEITEPRHLIHLVLLSKPGTKETIEVFRGDELITLEITVGVRPNNL